MDHKASPFPAAQRGTATKNRSQASMARLPQSMIPRAITPPAETMNRSQMKACCHESGPGGGQMLRRGQAIPIATHTTVRASAASVIQNRVTTIQAAPVETGPRWLGPIILAIHQNIAYHPKTN